MKRENRNKLRWIGAVLLVALLVNLYQPAAYALTTVGHVITGQPTSIYGEPVQLTSVVTDGDLGGATPAGSITFYDGGTLIGAPQELVASEPEVVYKSSDLAPVQAGKKFTCSDCPVIQWGGMSYWAYSDTDNNLIVYLYGYDANNTLVKSWQLSGNRYVTDITVNNIAKTVTFVGQNNVLTTRTWEQLENFNAHASMSFSGLGVGPHTITASYSGGDGIHSPQSSTFEHTVNTIQTNTTLTSNAGLIYVGEPITFTATVANTSGNQVIPGGTVTFRESSNVLGTTSVNGSGVATFTTSSLPVSGYSVTATYDGDGQHQTSTSSSLSQSVLGIPTVVAVSVSPGSTTYGNSVTLTATVTNGMVSIFGPTGTVTFKEGSTVLGTGTLSSGTATWTAPTLEVGTHSITAHYSGSLTHVANSSSSIPVVVNLIPTSSTLTVLGATNAASTYGTSLTLKASVTNAIGSPITPDGMVTFKDGSTTLGTAILNSGTAEWSVSESLSTGSHSFKAEYGGDSKHAVSPSAAVGHTVNKASTSTTLSSSGGISVGETTTLTVQVTNTLNPSIKPTGTVTFKNNGVDLQAPVPLNSSGTAVLATHDLPVGDLVITAEYSGDGNHVTSASQPITQPVSKAPVIVQLSVAPQSGESIYGHTVSVMVQVVNAGSGVSVPTGTVTLSGTGGFSNWPGALTLTNGTATWETEQLAVGTHTVVASYLGDDEHLNGVSTSSSLQIKPIPVTVVVTASVTEAVYYGTPLTFTAHVTNTNGESQIPAGHIVFSGGNLLNTPIHLDSAGTAFITSAALLPGTYPIQVAYVPDLLHEAQTSTPITQVIKPNTQGTVLILNYPSGTFQLGEPIQFSVSVGDLIGDLTQPGYISLKENGTERARVTTDVYGNADISLTGVSSGTHQYTALYERSGLTDGTESQSVTVVVKPAFAQLVLTGDAYSKVLPTSTPWTAAVVHGANSAFTFRAASMEAGTSTELKRMDPQSGQLGASIEVTNGQSEPVTFVEGLNRFQVKVVSLDGTASNAHIVSLFYQKEEKLWDITNVLAVTPLGYDMDGNSTFDKADIIALLKLIEPVSPKSLRP
ncbi:Ig-like domain-containing protein [Paenibacillus sp. HWE-109]|uniref:Ig-like domain-containing protein n=1 Tax=Paenibacillus sp. HWE-109 TaxID=1306526 RepID=UPI001EDD55A6|nr:Ig-like domain-containing protein [Paenibacillus sp. HWE-109]UKS27319.1 Ig-like domain-containing protein [Paenibacillus sp. HWE-109]